MASKDSNLSRGGVETPPGPINMHKLNKMGESPSGRSNPNGAPPDTSDKMAGKSKNY